MSTRNTTLAVAVLLVAAVTTGCGGAVTTASNTKADGVYAQIAGLPKDQQRAKAEQLAKKEGGTLSLYTSMTADIATPVAKAFEKKYGIKVDVFRGNSETVLQRTLQEEQAGRPGADAVETNFLEMTVLAGKGNFADYT